MVDKIHKTILAVVIVIAILAVGYTLINGAYAPSGAAIYQEGHSLKVSASAADATPGVSHSINEIEGLDDYLASAVTGGGDSFWTRGSGNTPLVYNPPKQLDGAEVRIGNPLMSADLAVTGDLNVIGKTILNTTKIEDGFLMLTMEDTNYVEFSVGNEDQPNDMKVFGDSFFEGVATFRSRVDLADAVYTSSDFESAGPGSIILKCNGGDLVLSGYCNCPGDSNNLNMFGVGSDTNSWLCGCSESSTSGYVMCLNQ